MSLRVCVLLLLSVGSGRKAGNTVDGVLRNRPLPPGGLCSSAWTTIRPPAGVEASIRRGPGKRLLFLLNHMDQPKTVTVPQGKSEHLSGAKTTDSITIDRFGVAVLDL